jgi:hypothetical protein
MAYHTEVTTILVPTTKYRTWSTPIINVGTADANHVSVPYIHAKEILIKGMSLGPYTPVFVTFDNIDVSAMCKPLTEAEYNANSVGAAAIGSQMVVGLNGTVYARFYLPANRFVVGRKILRITNSLDPSREVTYADSVFIAEGNTIFKDPYIEDVPINVYTQVWTPDPPVPPAPSKPWIQGGGGGTVICTKMYELGYINKTIYNADKQYGLDTIRTSPDTYFGYLSWASDAVDIMSGKGPDVFFWKKDRTIAQNLLTQWAIDMIIPWTHEMAFRQGKYHEGNITGKFLMTFGVPISKLVGIKNRIFGKPKSCGIARAYLMLSIIAMFRLATTVTIFMDKKNNTCLN